MMLRLMLCRRPREIKLAPVGDAADDAVGPQDLLAGRAGDFLNV